MVAFVILAVIILIVIYISVRNGIVRAENRCDNAWQTIDTQLQRRYDLIPNLIETVKGYMVHESATLQAVTDARVRAQTASTPQQTMDANDALTGAISRLFAMVESYPDLKASANFRQLQTELTETEDKISWARQSYNDCVYKYNNAIETFPGSLVAGNSFKTKQGFVAGTAARETPEVRF